MQTRSEVCNTEKKKKKKKQVHIKLPHNILTCIF